MFLDIDTKKTCIAVPSIEPDTDSDSSEPEPEGEPSPSDNLHSSVTYPNSTSTTTSTPVEEPTAEEEPVAEEESSPEHTSPKALSISTTETSHSFSEPSEVPTMQHVETNYTESPIAPKEPERSTTVTTPVISEAFPTDSKPATPEPMMSTTAATEEVVLNSTVSIPLIPEHGESQNSSSQADVDDTNIPAGTTETIEITTNTVEHQQEEMAHHHITEAVGIATTTEASTPLIIHTENSVSPLITTFITTRKELAEEIAATTAIPEETEGTTTTLLAEESNAAANATVKIVESTITPLEVLGMITAREGRTSKETELVALVPNEESTTTAHDFNMMEDATTISPTADEIQDASYHAKNETEIVVPIVDNEDQDSTTLASTEEKLRTTVQEQIEDSIEIVSVVNGTTTEKVQSMEDRTSSEFMVFSDQTTVTGRESNDDDHIEHTTTSAVSKEELSISEESETISLHNDTLVNELTDVTPDTVNTELIDDELLGAATTTTMATASSEIEPTSQRIEHEILSQEFQEQPSNRDHRETTGEGDAQKKPQQTVQQVELEQVQLNNTNDVSAHNNSSNSSENYTNISSATTREQGALDTDLFTVESRPAHSDKNSPFVSSDNNELKKK